MSDRIKGTVTRIVTEKSFGFIKANNVDHFFHRSAFDGDFEGLRPGDAVTFVPTESNKGPRAEQVRSA